MKSRLVTSLLAIALAGVTLGWLAERQNYASRNIEKVSSDDDISSTLSMAIYSNRIFWKLDTLDARSESDFQYMRSTQLIDNVFYLWKYDFVSAQAGDEITGNALQTDRQSLVLLQARRSLRLLNVNNEKQFAKQIADTDRNEEWKKELLTRNNELHDDFASFVRICLDLNCYEQLSSRVNRNYDDTIKMAECGLRLFKNNLLGEDQLILIEFDIRNITDESDGRKPELLERVGDALN